MELRAMPWHESIIEAELAKSKILVNATSIGLTSDVSPIPAEILAAGPARPRPDLRPDEAAPRRGGGRLAPCADGEQMLLHQGAAAFTLWTGMPAPIDVMQKALSDGARGRRPLGRRRAGRRRSASDGATAPGARRRRAARSPARRSTAAADRRAPTGTGSRAWDACAG